MSNVFIKIGLGLLVIIFYFGMLNMIVNGIVAYNPEQEVSDDGYYLNNADVNAFGIGHSTTTIFKKSKWYGMIKINQFDEVSFGKVSFLGLPIIVIVNDFDFMFIHIFVVLFMIISIILWSIFDNNLKGGVNKNEEKS